MWNWNKANRKVFCRLAESGAVVGGISVAFKEHLRNRWLRFRRRRIGMDQVLIANDQCAFRQSRYGCIGPLDSLHDHCAGGSAEHLDLRVSMDVRVIPI